MKKLILFFLLILSIPVFANVEGINVELTNTKINNFKPTDIEDCALWFDMMDSDTLILNPDGYRVASWLDKSGNANHLTQPIEANQPWWFLTAMNGKDSLRFYGTNDRLNNVLFNQGLLAIPNTVFIVCIFNSSVALDVIMDSYSAANRRLMYVAGDGVGFAIFAGSNAVDGGTIVNTTPYIWTAVFNRTSSYSRVDRAQITSLPSADTGTETFGSIRLGCRYDASRFFEGYISEVIVYSSSLSDADIETVENYLYEKWGF